MGISGMRTECDVGKQVNMNNSVSCRHVPCVLSNKLCFLGVSCDFAKALACENNDLLLKLNCYGI